MWSDGTTATHRYKDKPLGVAGIFRLRGSRSIQHVSVTRTSVSACTQKTAATRPTPYQSSRSSPECRRQRETFQACSTASVRFLWKIRSELDTDVINTVSQFPSLNVAASRCSKSMVFCSSLPCASAGSFAASVTRRPNSPTRLKLFDLRMS